MKQTLAGSKTGSEAANEFKFTVLALLRPMFPYEIATSSHRASIVSSCFAALIEVGIILLHDR